MLNDFLSEAEQKFKATLQHLREELSRIRAGQATPAMIENIKIEAYETEMVLKELAAISTPEPNQLLVQPWDQSILENIEKGLRKAGKGLNPAVEGILIRVWVPTLSEEQRELYIREVGEKVETARITVRNIRQDKLKSAERMEDEGKISNDELFRFKKDLQDKVDGVNEEIENIKKNKEEELRGKE